MRIGETPGEARYAAVKTDFCRELLVADDATKKRRNPYLQHWQVSNLFVLGASAFPQNASANPPPTIVALTYRTADAIVNRYVKNPGALA
jgi:gluconate 2-dehydrogenase alpha chain